MFYGVRETGNEIMLRDPCAQRAYQTAGPDQDKNMNHLLATLAGFMEIRDGSFGVMYQSKAGSVVTPDSGLFSPASCLSVFFILTHLIPP